MYYKLKTGRIISDKELRITYEIIFGHPYMDDYNTYNTWVSYLNLTEVNPDTLSVVDWVRGGCMVQAVAKYKKDNGVSLRKATEVCRNIRNTL